MPISPAASESAEPLPPQESSKPQASSMYSEQEPRRFPMASTLQTDVLQHVEPVPHSEALQSTPELPTDWRITPELQLWTRQIISQQTPQTFVLESAQLPPPPPSLLQEIPTLIQTSLPTLPPLREPLPSATKSQLPPPSLNSSTPFLLPLQQIPDNLRFSPLTEPMEEWGLGRRIRIRHFVLSAG